MFIISELTFVFCIGRCVYLHGSQDSFISVFIFVLLVTQIFSFALKFKIYFTNFNVSDRRVEVLQGYICSILLASHSTYKPSSYSAHWLDLPRYNSSQHRGKFAMSVVN